MCARANAGKPVPRKLRELQDFIVKRLDLIDVPLEQYPWLSEEARWHELAFCIIVRLAAADFDADVARTLVDMLAGLGLLQVQGLASLVVGGRRWGRTFFSPRRRFYASAS